MTSQQKGYKPIWAIPAMNSPKPVSKPSEKKPDVNKSQDWSYFNQSNGVKVSKRHAVNNAPTITQARSQSPKSVISFESKHSTDELMTPMVKKSGEEVPTPSANGNSRLLLDEQEWCNPNFNKQCNDVDCSSSVDLIPKPKPDLVADKSAIHAGSGNQDYVWQDEDADQLRQQQERERQELARAEREKLRRLQEQAEIEWRQRQEEEKEAERRRIEHEQELERKRVEKERSERERNRPEIQTGDFLERKCHTEPKETQLQSEANREDESREKIRHEREDVDPRQKSLLEQQSLQREEKFHQVVNKNKPDVQARKKEEQVEKTQQEKERERERKMLMNEQVQVSPRRQFTDLRSKEKNQISSRSYRARYLRVQEQYPEVLTRLEHERTTTPVRLEWSTANSGRESVTLSKALKVTADQSNWQQNNSNIMSPNAPTAPNNIVRKNSTPSSRDNSVLNSNTLFDADLSNIDDFHQKHVHPTPIIVSLKSASAESHRTDDTVIPRVNRARSTDLAEFDPYASERLLKTNRNSEEPPSFATQNRRLQRDFNKQYAKSGYAAGRPKSAITTRGARDQQQMSMSTTNAYIDDYIDNDESVSDAESQASFTSLRSNSAAKIEAQKYQRTLYYYGVVRLPKNYWSVQVPVTGFHRLDPIERAAYMFYYSLHCRFITDIGGFQKMFKYQHIRAMFERNLNEDNALIEIVGQMRDEWQKQMEEEAKAREARKRYEKAQQALWSPINSTIDGSRIDSENSAIDGSVRDCDARSERLYQVNAISGPLKYRHGHTIGSFAAPGIIINRSVALPGPQLHMYSVKDMITSRVVKAQIACLESFGSALLPHTSPAHTVQLYCTRRLKQLRENQGDAIDSDAVLLWRLLKLVVQQRGRVHGPDIAALLADELPVNEQYNCYVQQAVKSRVSNAQAAVQLRSLCAGGHLREALQHAQRQNLWPEALFLAYKLGDYRIFDKFVSTFAINDPVRTVSQLLSGLTPDMTFSDTLDTRKDDDERASIQSKEQHEDPASVLSWRGHAAVLLANMSNVQSINSGQNALLGVYNLSCELARAGRFVAADICLLCVHLLAGWNIFTPPTSNDALTTPYTINLLHATESTKVDDPHMYTTADLALMRRYSIWDIQATCVYDYAVRLRTQPQQDQAEQLTPLQMSLAMGVTSTQFWLARLHYAQLLASYSLHDDAMTFCYQLATTQPVPVPPVEAWHRLEQLTQRLKYLCAVDTSWVEPTFMPDTVTPPSASIQQQEQPQSQPQTLTDSQIAPVQPHQGIQHQKEKVEESMPPTNNNYTESHFYPSYKEVNNSISDDIPPTSTTTTSRRTSNTTTPADEYSGNYQDDSLHSNINSASIRHLSAVPEQSPPISPPSNVEQKTNFDQMFQRNSGSVVNNDDKFSSPAYPNDSEMVTNDARNEKPTSFSIGTPKGDCQTPIPSQLYTNDVKEHESVFREQTPSSQRPQKPIENERTNQQVTSKPDRYQGRLSGSLMQSWSQSILKMIPRSDAMKLPDDNNPSLVWDPVAKRWIGDGVENDTVDAPPPSNSISSKMPTSPKDVAEPQKTLSGSLRDQRSIHGSRYKNQFGAMLSGGSNKAPAQQVDLKPPVPTANKMYGFMPAAPVEDSDVAADPFTEQQSPFSTADMQQDQQLEPLGQ